MASDIEMHGLNDYNLKIYDDDYTDFSSQCKTAAANVEDIWCGFIKICSELKGSTMKGAFADAVNEIAVTVGDAPGQNFMDDMYTAAADASSYIEEIDVADGDLY